MILLVGVELTKFARDIRLNLDLVCLAVTVAVAVFTNMAFGFAAGTAAYYLVRLIRRRRGTIRSVLLNGCRRRRDDHTFEVCSIY